MATVSDTESFTGECGCTAELVESVRGLTQRLTSHIPDAGGHGASIDLIGALEILKRAVEGTQLAVTADFTEALRSEAEAQGVPPERSSRGIGEQVALARRESPHRGRQAVQLATVLPRELPCTYAALREGRITGWHASAMARETAHVDLQTRKAIDTALAGELDALTPMQLAGRARAAADQADPAAAVKRRRNAEADRHVSLRPAPDTMAWLTALVPVTEGVAAYATLRRAADELRAQGDSRSGGQLMADLLVDRVTGSQRRRTEEAPDDARDGERAAADAEPTDVAGTTVRVNLVVSDRVLFGTEESAAQLEHAGQIPAELARELVRHAAAAGYAELRRLYVDQDGRVVALDSSARCFPAPLAELIRLRDQVCRTPWCDAPVRHIDHVTPHAEGGPTSFHNGQGLCEACNYAKQAAGWRHRLIRGPAGEPAVETTTPTGHVYLSPEPTAPRPATPGYRLDVVLPAA